MSIAAYSFTASSIVSFLSGFANEIPVSSNLSCVVPLTSFTSVSRKSSVRPIMS
jgi:hypothetical protein